MALRHGAAGEFGQQGDAGEPLDVRAVLDAGAEQFTQVAESDRQAQPQQEGGQQDE